MVSVRVFNDRWRRGAYLPDEPVSQVGVTCEIKCGVYAEHNWVTSLAHARDRYRMWGVDSTFLVTVNGKVINDEEAFTLSEGDLISFHRRR